MYCNPDEFFSNPQVLPFERFYENGSPQLDSIEELLVGYSPYRTCEILGVPKAFSSYSELARYFRNYSSQVQLPNIVADFGVC